MAIIKQYHKDTHTTYVYKSESYWDSERKQARSKRKCIGKIDPETGEIVPTGRRGKKSTKDTADIGSGEYAKLIELNEDAKKQIVTLTAKVDTLEKELAEQTQRNRILENKLQKIHEIAQ